MGKLIVPIMVALIVSGLVCIATVPWVKKLAISCGALDKPDARKVHKAPIPLWGGLAVFLGFVVGLTLALYVWPENVLPTPLQFKLVGVVLSGFLILLVGMWDDRYGMKAMVKLFLQIVVACLLIYFGVRIDYFNIPGMGMIYLPGMIGNLFTVFWIVGIMNAVNLLDGLDGLVAGVSGISATLFAIVVGWSGQYVVMIGLIALVGACLGFLRYNFNPATIFMGDTGSLFVGLMFAVWSIVGVFKVTTTVALAIPVVLILGLPILDTSFAIVRRGVARKPIFKPDKGHIHHRVLDLGLSHRDAVLVIYGVNFMLGALGIGLAYFLS